MYVSIYIYRHVFVYISIHIDKQIYFYAGTPLADGTAKEIGSENLLPKAVPPTALEMTRMIATARVCGIRMFIDCDCVLYV